MPGRTTRCFALLTLLTLACRPRAANLCPNLEVAADEAEEHKAHSLDPLITLTSMVSTLDSGTLLPPAEIRDCRAQRIESPLNACDDQTAATERRTERPLSGDDLVITDGEGDNFLVWAQARHFTDGDAFGPVAVAQWSRRGIRVSILAGLRGPAKHPRLRLETLGEGQVLVLEGDTCPPDNGPCTRVVRVIPLLEGSFVDRAVRHLEDGSCGGPATFPLSASEDETLGPNKLRRFRIARNVVIKDGLGVVYEEAIATDHDPGQPNAEGVEHRRIKKARELMLDKDGLLVQRGSWDDLRAEDGSVRPSDHVPPVADKEQPDGS